jgi:hypothetical protein
MTSSIALEDDRLSPISGLFPHYLNKDLGVPKGMPIIVPPFGSQIGVFRCGRARNVSA